MSLFLVTVLPPAEADPTDAFELCFQTVDVCTDEVVEEVRDCAVDLVRGTSNCLRDCEFANQELCATCPGDNCPAPCYEQALASCLGPCFEDGVVPCTDHVVCDIIGVEGWCIRCTAEGCHPCDFTDIPCTGPCDLLCDGEPVPCGPTPAVQCVYWACTEIFDQCDTCQAEQCSPCYWAPLLCYPGCSVEACQVLTLCDIVPRPVCDALEDPCGRICVSICADTDACVCDEVFMQCPIGDGYACVVTGSTEPVGVCGIAGYNGCYGVIVPHGFQSSGALVCPDIANVSPGTSCVHGYVWVGNGFADHAYVCNREPALGQCFSAGDDMFVTIHEQCILTG